MRRAFSIITAAAFAVLIPGAGASTIPVIDYSQALPPDLSTQAPWTPFSVRLALDLIALEQYQADLQRFHAWLGNLGQRSLEEGGTR